MSKRALEQATCGNCANSMIENGVMHCTLNPPATFPLVAIMPDAAGNPTPKIFGWASGWPAVPATAKCGQHKRALIVEHNAAPPFDLNFKRSRVSRNEGF